MKRVWSDESKYGKWLLIELAACEAWAEEGVIPQDDLVKLRGATLDIGRVAEEIARTRHDMPAFLRAVSETLGPEARWLHLGLTTSDVWDTTTSLQLVDAADLLSEEIDNLIGALRRRAIEHKDTPMMGPHPRGARGADHLRGSSWRSGSTRCAATRTASTGPARAWPSASCPAR